MWAIGNEPNLGGYDFSFATIIAQFFRFVNKAAVIRDEEEGDTPHPLMVPMADDNFQSLTETYDYAKLDIWGVQPYRGTSFGDLFSQYKSAKPLLISEYGMDSLIDIQFGNATTSFEW